MITDKDLDKLKKLAKLDFSAEESAAFSTKLTNVMGMVDQLQEVDADGIKPLRSVCDMYQTMKEDKVEIDDISDDLFENVPAGGAKIAREVKCFVVPKVIE